MIPLRLVLKNFLPYRNPDELRFEGIHLACLTGPNGAGKSSLLDAITWALWGRARARRDDDLIYLGQTEMSVLLEFEQEGVVYQVFRQRSAGKRGQSLLNFNVRKEDGSWTLLNRANLRDTERLISEVLRLDYETFVHSAFLQQGKADAFTTATPAERKRILSTILGLDRWERYEDRVKKKLREIDDQMKRKKWEIEEAERELRQEGAYRQELEAASQDFEALQKLCDEAQERLDEVQHAGVSLQHALDDQRTQQRRQRELEGDIARAEQEVAQINQRLQTRRDLIARAAEIEEGYQALQEAKAQDRTLAGVLERVQTLRLRSAEVQRAMDAERAVLDREAGAIAATIASLRERTQAASEGEAELIRLEEEISGLRAREEEREKLLAEEEALVAEQSATKTHKETLTNRGKEMRERLEKLEKTEGATCPLCGQPLDEDHRLRLLDELNVELEARRADYVSTEARLKSIDGERKALRQRIEALGRELARLPELNSRAGAARKAQSDAAQAQTRLQEEEGRLTELQRRLAQADYAPAERAELAAVQEELSQLDYDAEAHESHRRSLDEYQSFERQHSQLEAAREHLSSDETLLQGIQERVERLHLARAELVQALANLDEQIVELRALETERVRRSDELRHLRTQREAASNRVHSAQQQLAALEMQRARLKQFQAEQESLQGEQALYDDLRRAFGKNGVPALLIESAIPELEASANEMLARMTDGRMHLRLSTQKNNQDGTLRETLEIEIADELGTRAYEMYSGGEAFRINFALRVALSRMLARRAGAHLRTLFIDEGFGTQDDDGRNKLVEAITAIQDQFDMILVITHIDELRDSFPVHIIIDKGGDGSRITVR